MTDVQLYDVVVGHTRHIRPKRSFRYRLTTWLVDLNSLPELPRWLSGLARFESRDHLGDPQRTIRENLDNWLASHGIDLCGGQILMLTHPRVLGYVFNPITVYWCHHPGGELECVVAEVHNTYGERHCYLLRPDADGVSEVDKQFYVSPFLADHGYYRMRMRPPGERVSLHVELIQDGRKALTATLIGHRRPATTKHVVKAAIQQPLVPQRVSALIRRQGIALWLRRTPIATRRAHIHQEGVR